MQFDVVNTQQSVQLDFHLLAPSVEMYVCFVVVENAIILNTISTVSPMEQYTCCGKKKLYKSVKSHSSRILVTLEKYLRNV